MDDGWNRAGDKLAADIENDGPDPRVLEWVNEQRVKHLDLGPLDSLPLGWPSSGTCDCPIARALPGSRFFGRTAGTATVPWVADEEIHYPDFIGDFIHGFDRYRFPALIAPRA